MTNIHIEQTKIKELEGLLSCTYDKAQAAFRWKSKQSIQLQLWANQQSVNKYLSLKKLYKQIDSNILSLAGALIISFEIYSIFQKSHRKNTNFKTEDMTLVNLLELNEFAVAKRVSKKRDTLTRKYSQILKWRESNISYQSISTKILTIDGESISAEYIRIYVTKFKGATHA